MLINDLRCPIYTLIKQLTKLEREQLLPDSLNQTLDHIITDYCQKKEVCEEMKAIPEQLDDHEYRILKRLYDSLDTALNGKIYHDAYQSFNSKTECSKQKEFMAFRYGLFQEFNKQAHEVQKELKEFFQAKQLNQ